MHYKGTGKVHSFRGLLEDGGQNKISIQGSVGATAWRITKFVSFPNLPGTQNYESTVLIWREFQTSVSTTIATVDFRNDELLAAAYYMDGSDYYHTSNLVTIFDNALFSRNIYVTHTATEGSQSMNYYIELEEVTLSAAGKAQLAVVAARRRSHLGD